MRAAVLFMLKSPWLNWRADSNSEELIKWSKVHSGVRHGGLRHAAGTVQNVDARDAFFLVI